MDRPSSISSSGGGPSPGTPVSDTELRRRWEGQLSKFATDIVDAVKSGRLDQIKPQKSEAENNNKSETKKSPENPESKLKTEVRVERRVVAPPKQSEIETIVIPKRKLEKKCSCCVLL